MPSNQKPRATTTMTKEEVDKLPRLITGPQDMPPPVPLEDQFDKILMSLGSKFATYRKKCEKALNEAQSAESYLICAKFQEHVSCWDIAISDIKDVIGAYRSGRAAEQAKAVKAQNEQQPHQL